MLFESVEELDYVRSKMWATFRERFAAKGYHLGAPGDVGFIYFYSNTPVSSVADLAKTKVWMWGEDPVVRAMFKKLGVSGVPLGVPDVLPALNTGRIDAAYGSPMAAVALQWYSKVKFSTSMPMSYGIGASVIKKDQWDALAPAVQAKIEKIMDYQGKRLRQTVRRDNQRAFKAITRSGVKVVETPAAMVADFEKNAKARVAGDGWQALQQERSRAGSRLQRRIPRQEQKIRRFVVRAVAQKVASPRGATFFCGELPEGPAPSKSRPGPRQRQASTRYCKLARMVYPRPPSASAHPPDSR